MNTFTSHTSLLSKLNSEEQVSLYSGIIFGPVNSQSPEFSYNADEYFIPASCQKMVTGLVAIKELGKDFSYKTTLEYSPSNLAGEEEYRVRFSGDPTLMTQNMVQLLSPLKGKKIKGSLKIDHSAYQTPEWSPHLMEEDIGSDYASPMLAAIINRNAFQCTVYPEQHGKSSYIKGLENIRYICKATHSSTIPRSKIDVSWQQGCLMVNASLVAGEENLEAFISHPSAKFILEIYLKKILEALEITFEQGIEFIGNKTSFKGEVLNTHDSPFLEAFLPIAMKQSDNLVFDALYLTLLHRYGGSEWVDGNEIFKKLIKKHLDINFAENVMLDGAGAARENQLQPSLLWQILKKGFEEPLFISSLAKSGEKNTTLEHRSELPSSLIAKTGTMRGVSGLCGYIGSSSSPQAFVIFLRQDSLTLYELHEKQEAIIKILV